MTAEMAFRDVTEEVRRCQELKIPYPDKLIVCESLSKLLLMEYGRHYMSEDGLFMLYGIPVEIVPDLQIVRRL